VNVVDQEKQVPWDLVDHLDQRDLLVKQVNLVD